MEGYEYHTKPKAQDSQIVKGDKWRLTVLTDGLVRCEWADDRQFEDRASTFAINRDLPAVKFRTYEKDGVLNVVTDRFHLGYDKKPFSANGLFIDVKGKGLQGNHGRWRFGNLGSSLGGTARTLDDVNGRCELGPGVVSRRGYAALDDKESMLFDGNNWVAGRRAGNREDLYVFCYGLDYRTAVKAFFAVSGNQPEVPRYTFGNWWSRYHAYSEKEYLELMDRFAADDIPLSIAVIDMDWHLVDDKRATHRGWTGYSWNKTLFPDPPAFLKSLHGRNLKVTLNDHPADGVHAFEDVYEDMANDMGFDTSQRDPIPFDSTNPNFMKAYLKMFHSLGVDFDWIDWQQGAASATPGVDPLWLLNHYHYLANRTINKTPLVFSRYAGPGSHRYPIGFSGDSHVTWESLHFQPEFTATASNIGFGWWSHDIGGHMFGERSDEMVTRWVQLGAFSPFLRLHSTHSRWMSKEPWRYFTEYKTAISQMLRFRHRLIPYLHTMNRRAAKENEPLVQPVYWHFPDRVEAYAFPNSYYFGSELFVAPITTPRSTVSLLGSVQAWLPPGPRRWVDIFTGRSYDADRTHTFYRPVDQIPVFAPEGSIIPLDANEWPKNGAANPVGLELLIIPGADAAFTLVEDLADDPPDFKLPDAAQDASERRITFTWTQADRKLRLDHEGPSPPRALTLRFVGTVASHTIQLPAEPRASVQLDMADLELGAPPLEPRLEPLLESYQTAFHRKQRIWDGATAKGVPLDRRIAALLQLKEDEEVLGPVLELMLADLRGP